MMQHYSQHERVLSIAPSTRGFGYAVLEDAANLVDWGSKSVEGNKNTECLIKVEALIAHYQPTLIVLEDHSGKDSRRSARIVTLGKRLVALASQREVKVKLFSQAQVRRVFFGERKGTKHALAEILAKRFPEELGHRLPPKRRAWTSEDSRMDIFDAMALVMALRRL